tara:strand:- start:155 stop:361 length:207 start_codon:yes stop_codon:yes gene_type:complete
VGVAAMMLAVVTQPNTAEVVVAAEVLGLVEVQSSVLVVEQAVAGPQAEHGVITQPALVRQLPILLPLV